VSLYTTATPSSWLRLAFLAIMGPTIDTVRPLGLSNQAYLSLHSSEDLSCLFFTCTNANQAAICTCNTQPRVSPHHVVNHSSLRSDHPPVLRRSNPQVHYSLTMPLSACSMSMDQRRKRENWMQVPPHVSTHSCRLLASKWTDIRSPASQMVSGPKRGSQSTMSYTRNIHQHLWKWLVINP
jgi:hypothetical protein